MHCGACPVSKDAFDVPAEYKIQYLVTPGVAKQQYDVRLFLFFGTELDPVQNAFFGCLYEAVRLHLPKVPANVRCIM